jgi:hypothetical protein
VRGTGNDSMRETMDWSLWQSRCQWGMCKPWQKCCLFVTVGLAWPWQTWFFKFNLNLKFSPTFQVELELEAHQYLIRWVCYLPFVLICIRYDERTWARSSPNGLVIRELEMKEQFVVTLRKLCHTFCPRKNWSVFYYFYSSGFDAPRSLSQTRWNFM